jgi:hypothetical protein
MLHATIEQGKKKKRLGKHLLQVRNITTMVSRYKQADSNPFNTKQK